MSSKNRSKSPAQSVAIRSPMEKHMSSPPKSSGKRSTAESVDDDSVSGTLKISFASPISSRAASRSNTPSKGKEDSQASSSSSKSKSTQKKAADKTKKKISDLEALEVDQKASLEKLRADSKRVKARIAKLEEEAAKIKFPVKDEVLGALLEAAAAPAATSSKSKAASAAADTSMEPRKPLPAAVLQLNSMLPDDLVNDAVGVWDFLNVFSKTLSIGAISWEDFVDLLKFTSKPSLALTDLFCSLLRLALADSALLTKVSALIPRKVNYAYRQQGEFELNPTGEVEFNMADLLQQDDFDCEYNGLKLLPRKLKLETVDALRWQAVLRSVILRLEPVKQLRRAVLDVTNVAHMSCLSSEPCMEHNELDALVGLASAFKRQRTRTPHSKAVSSEVMTAVKARPSDGDSSAVPQTAQKVMSSASMAAINTPKATKSKQHASGLDKDAIFQITSDVSAPLKTIYEAANQLETLELHQLRAQYKVVLMKVLCDACLDTSRIKQLLERNAEERYVQIQNMNKQMREQKTKQKEVSGTKKEAAFQACRKINIAAAEAEAARVAALEKKKLLSASKKKKGPATPVAAAASSKGKGKGKAKPAAAAKGTSKGASKGEVKGPGGGKDGLDPTPEQLNAMIEELVILEAAGVEVVEEIPMDAPTEEEEAAAEEEGEDSEPEFDYDARGNLVQRAKRQRRVTSQVRAKTLDRKRINAERRQRQQLVQIAEARLAHALDTRSEKEMRAAIKQGEKSGCKGVNDDGKAFCTPLMKQVYMKLHEMDVQAKEDKQASQHERALQEYFVRTTPIGSDRHQNTYWSFVGDDRLFVQSRAPLSAEEAAACPVPPLSGRDHDSNLTRLFDSRPNRFRYKWSVYSSATEQWKLWDALDERGERELALKAAIKARFDIEEPPVVYELTGSAFIGKKVKRTFGRRKPVYGLIVGWLPPTSADPALWHVQHLDGDEEDLDEAEVLECLAQSAEDVAADASSSTAMEVVDLCEDEPDAKTARTSKRESPRLSGTTTSAESTAGTTAISRKESSTSLASAVSSSRPTRAAAAKSSDNLPGDESDAEFDGEEAPYEEVPRIASLGSGLARGIPIWRATPLTNAVGAQALRTEYTRVLGLLNDGLKARNGNLSREGRKLWEHSVRDAETAVELRGPLLELESLVRNLQTVEDKRDAEEVRLAKEAERKEMLKEGWIFDAAQNEYIGKQARRFFKGFGSSDGDIVAYLPPEKNDGVALYHMQHSDGDAEDLELEDLQRALRYRETDAQEEDEEDGAESDGESEDASSEEDSDSEDEDEEDELHAPDSAGATLWPTFEVRSRWLAALSSANTLGELALALLCFLEQATAFGVVAQDPSVAEKPLAPRSARLAVARLSSSAYVVDSPEVNKRSSSRTVSRKSSKKDQHSGGRERLSRAAARAVRSYAE